MRIVVLAAVAVDRALAEHLPAVVVPAARVRGVVLDDLEAPDLDARRNAIVADVLVAKVDVADDAEVTRQIDHARARAFAEEVMNLGMEPLAIAERDLEVEELHLAALDIERQLREAPLVRADVDLVVIVTSVDRAFAELDPAR